MFNYKQDPHTPRNPVLAAVLETVVTVMSTVIRPVR